MISNEFLLSVKNMTFEVNVLRNMRVLPPKHEVQVFQTKVFIGLSKEREHVPTKNQDLIIKNRHQWPGISCHVHLPLFKRFHQWPRFWGLNMLIPPCYNHCIML